MGGAIVAKVATVVWVGLQKYGWDHSGVGGATVAWVELNGTYQ